MAQGRKGGVLEAQIPRNVARQIAQAEMNEKARAAAECELGLSRATPLSELYSMLDTVRDRAQDLRYRLRDKIEPIAMPEHDEPDKLTGTPFDPWPAAFAEMRIVIEGIEYSINQMHRDIDRMGV